MREWRRVPVETLCGGCPKTIPKDAPALFITLPNVKREKVRCEECEGPAPPDLPPRETRPQMFTKRMKPTKGIAAGFTRERLSDADWTARILGERP